MIHVEQKLYIQKLIAECGMSDCKPCVAPFPLAEDVDDDAFENVTFYRKVVGSLLFLANNYRCDIAYAVGKVSQACKYPTRGDWKSVKHILRYLRGTDNLCLRYEKKGQPIKVYCDASWNSEPKGKSIGGFVVIFAGGALTWHSKKQSCVATSTEESELISMSEAVREVKWLRNLFAELGQSKFLERPCIVNCDNTQAMRLGLTGVVTKRSKHIDLKYHFCNEQVEVGNVLFQYVPSEENISDIFTKPLPGCKIRSFNALLGLQRKD
ncbi:hypothetical protein J437_LFUL016090 [Ladona fulva]|uniref:Uncharacterized protein n=1 Tax=Ladona fulva TaxID=123851 RepID=A0A8K0KK96_LADFU|nr:hypothetical protein J437_LFUL016090 [Ladona fulva]